MDTNNSEPQTGFRVADGLQIRYAETGGSSSHRIVLTSPWPESLHAFRRVWPKLSKTAGLLAIDLPGFGRSERRTDLLSPLPMSEFIVRLLDEWEISEPHLVSPDVGTSAALFAAARYPGRFRSLVVGTGASAIPLQVGGLLKDIIEAPNIDVFRALKPDALVHGAIGGLRQACRRRDCRLHRVEQWRQICRVHSLRAELSRAAPHPPRSVTGDPHARSDHHGQKGPACSCGKCRIPPRTLAQQQTRRPRHRPLRVGGSGRTVRIADHRVGDRRVPTPADQSGHSCRWRAFPRLT